MTSVFLRLSFLLLLVAGCSTPSPRSQNQARLPGSNLYAVVSAYRPEVEANEKAFLDTNQPVRVEHLNGVEFKFVRFAGHDLVLFPAGVSMVNAAMTTQLALDHFPITAVLFAGIAGGINPALKVGDVVVPDRWAHHSEAAYFNPKPDGSGYVFDNTFKPKYENFGFMFPSDTHVIRAGMSRPEDMPSFPADESLLAAARRASTHLPNLTYESRTCQVRIGGVGISGPVFCDNREYRRWAFRVWNADCLDMESSSVAQVCWANRIPCLIVRSLSDLAGGQEGQNPEEYNESIVSIHASEVLREIVRELPK
jgi:adenosylhomocysteine nucleosidase